MQANWQGRGRYYGGRLTKVTLVGNNCRYSISYNDGDSETNVPESRVRATVCLGYQRCDRVQVNYRGLGRFYAARISSHPTRGQGCLQKYNIQYDDGDTGTNVAPTLIRRMTASRSATFRANQAVEANYRGRGQWYPGSIQRVVSPCCYQVRYSDGDNEACVDPLKIRARVTRACTDSGRRACTEGFTMEGNWRGYGRWYPGVVSSCSNGLFNLAYADGTREKDVRGARIRNCRTACNRRAPLATVNQSVMANWHNAGRFYPGVISAVQASACTYTIAYCDGDAESNVPASRIRFGGNIAVSARCVCATGGYTMNRRARVNAGGRGTLVNGRICGCSSSTTYKICYANRAIEPNVPRSWIRI